MSIDLDLLRKSAPEAVLHRPFGTAAILSGLLLARCRFAYERRLRGRIEKLDKTLRAMRSVERAKTILMSRAQDGRGRGIRLPALQAMERRVSVGAIAAAIVDANELIG